MDEAKSAKMRKIKVSDLTMYLALVGVIVVFVIACSAKGIQFMTLTNITNIIVQAAVVAVVAIGSTIVILTGGIDLSCGAIIGMTGIISAINMRDHGFGIAPALLLGVAIGVFVGFLTGLGVTFGKIPAFIMTLGVQQVCIGIRLAVSGGQPVAGMPLALSDLANTRFFGIPVFIFYVAIAYVIMCFVMAKTRFGRRIYAIGGNRSCAKLSGVNVHKVEMLTYILAGLFSGIGGMMLLARLCYASTSAGDGYEMDCIAAVVIGGTSLSGGQGKLFNSLIGAILLATLKAGLQILDVSTAYQNIATGLIIILFVFIDKARDRKAE